MARYVRLSYDITIKSPVYSGDFSPLIEQIKDINNGDSCNKFCLRISSHCGTHIDTPRHFYAEGSAVTDYGIDKFIFCSPFTVKCRKKPSEAITINDLIKAKIAKTCDFLFIKTGFSRFRAHAPDIYCTKNPYISLAAADWLRVRFPSIRGIGIDCISISSVSNKTEGRKAHKIFLRESEAGNSTIFLIEDLYIPSDVNQIRKVMVFPLFVKDIDSAPCTVIGVLDD